MQELKKKNGPLEVAGGKCAKKKNGRICLPVPAAYLVSRVCYVFPGSLKLFPSSDFDLDHDRVYRCDFQFKQKPLFYVKQANVVGHTIMALVDTKMTLDLNES